MGRFTKSLRSIRKSKTRSTCREIRQSALRQQLLATGEMLCG